MNTSNCNKCGSAVQDNLERCTTCYTFVGYPNVRIAERIAEVNALDERYNKAFEEAVINGTDKTLIDFACAMKKTNAIINVSLQYLTLFITNDNEIYSNYHLRVAGDTRKPALSEDDTKRRTADVRLHGNSAENIRHAALSLDGNGLISYGNCALQLKELVIADRASLLEENSYNFVEHHGLSLLPLGYKTSWSTRHKLATAKLADKISIVTTAKDYANILLQSKGDRHTDEFIEVHIYGGFDNNAVSSVRWSPSKSKPNKYDFVLKENVKDLLTNKGIGWTEA